MRTSRKLLVGAYSLGKSRRTREFVSAKMVQEYVNTIAEEGQRKRRREDWYKNRHKVQNWFYENSWCPPFYKYWIGLSRKEEIGQLRNFLSAFYVDIDPDSSQRILHC